MNTNGIGVVKTLVRGGRCEADWFDRRGEPRCSLEDRSCQGMVLTAVSSAWPQDGRHTSWVSWGNAHRTQATLSRRDADGDQAKTNWPKALEPSAGEERNHLWAVAVPAVVKAARCVSNRTRPVSWLGSTSFGTHPRTKGARCSAGG
ncbi:MAG: hypothetical protein KDH16_22945, partial [Rhodocyclaceae bacterium]|nr:hypothetical protein [Rhodocyclaceae bacterium]